MSKPSIARCFDELVEYPSLLGLFLGEECTSLLELPVVGALQLRLISERFFTQVWSPTIWEKTGGEYITETGLRLSGEATPMAIFITDRVGKGDLGMVTTFCSNNQVKMEASEVLDTLHQHDSPEPSVSVVRRYTNTPFIPQGTSRLLYLNVSDIPRGASSTQFPLNCLYLWKMLSYSKTEVLLPHEEGEMGYRTYPISQEVLWKCSKDSHCLSKPVSLSMPSLAPPPCLEEGIQMEGKLGYNPALQCLQGINQARAQLESEQSEEA